MKKEKDNKYHWKYEMNLYKNPTILFLLFKIFGCICLGIWLFSTLILVDNVDFWWNGFLKDIKSKNKDIDKLQFMKMINKNVIIFFYERK